MDCVFQSILAALFSCLGRQSGLKQLDDFLSFLSTLDASGQNICLESDTTYKQFDVCGVSFSPQLGTIQNLATL